MPSKQPHIPRYKDVTPGQLNRTNQSLHGAKQVHIRGGAGSRGTVNPFSINFRSPMFSRMYKCYIAEIDSNATGGGYYNCHLQSLDATDWDSTTADQLDDVGESVVVLNLAEIGSSIWTLKAGDSFPCWKFTDDEGAVQYIGYRAVNGTVFFGKPTGAFSSGATITLDPCDIHGTDNGHANITVYVQPSQASYSMTNSTTIPTSCICPYVRGDDGAYYLLGNPIEIVTDIDVSATVMTKKTRNAWVLTVGEESAAVTIDTFTTSCP